MWLQQWNTEVRTGPFIDLALFKRILHTAVDKYCGWDWAERTLFDRIKNISNNNDDNNMDKYGYTQENVTIQERYLTAETFASSLTEVAPTMAAKHAQEIFFSLDEYGIGRVTLPQFKRILLS